MTTMSTASSLDLAANLSVDSLQQEIREAEQALQENERKRLALETAADEVADDPAAAEEPLAVRLRRLEATANDLLLTQQIAEWKQHYLHSSDDSLVDQVDQLELLKNILLQVDEASETYERLVEDDYLPYCDYLYDELKLSLRNLLQQSNYPTIEGCHDLLEQKGVEGGTYQDIVETCEALYRLTGAHEQVVRHVGLDDDLLDREAALRELCRPFVERVDFHFVQHEQQSGNHVRPTANRIDRLPEWICSYVKEHALQGGPWEFVQSLASSLPDHCYHLPLNYINEQVRLMQWIFGERNFFRHPVIVGPDSKPMYLMAAIEHLIRFDDYAQSLLQGQATDRLLKLMDVLVGGDDELLGWWLEREREYVFSTLFSEQVTTALVSRVSPRAELFCSIIRSIQSKAAVFSFSGPYLGSVAAPLCMQFVDAVDESSASLRAQLVAGRDVPSDRALEANVNQWIELINGTHMAALILYADFDEPGAVASVEGSQDLARFGRSLQNLEAVLVDEFAKLMVGTVLMERGKLASYLVRCSRLLSCDEHEVLDFPTRSLDLLQTRRLLSKFLAVSDDPASVDMEDEEAADAVERSRYAPKLMKERVLDVLAGKILEVALNLDEMTSELHPAGCSIFAADIESLFGSSLVPTSVLRLLDIVKIMSMPSLPLCQLGDALCGLVGQPAPLGLDCFAADEKLYDEAMSMVHAKGMVWLDLADVVNVLNRRLDLRPRPYNTF